MIVDDEGITFDESQFPSNDPYGPLGDFTRNAQAPSFIRELTPREALQNELAETDAAYGIAPRKDFYGSLREELEKDRDYGLTKKDIASDALIAGGLGIAAGTSANALENIAAGGKAGFESYAQGRKDLRDSELGLRKGLRAIDVAERAEGTAKRDLDDQLNYKLRALAAEQGLSQEKIGNIYIESLKLASKEAEAFVMGTNDPFYTDRALKKFNLKDASQLTPEQKRQTANEYLGERADEHLSTTLETVKTRTGSSPRTQMQPGDTANRITTMSN
jgi:hypothetical protein